MGSPLAPAVVRWTIVSFSCTLGLIRLLVFLCLSKSLGKRRLRKKTFFNRFTFFPTLHLALILIYLHFPSSCFLLPSSFQLVWQTGRSVMRSTEASLCLCCGLPSTSPSTEREYDGEGLIDKRAITPAPFSGECGCRMSLKLEQTRGLSRSLS